MDDFKCVKKFKIFNTNNLWINLKAIRERVVQGTLERDVIVNHKALGDGNYYDIFIYQLFDFLTVKVKTYFQGIAGVKTTFFSKQQ